MLFIMLLFTKKSVKRLYYEICDSILNNRMFRKSFIAIWRLTLMALSVFAVTIWFTVTPKDNFASRSFISMPRSTVSAQSSSNHSGSMNISEKLKLIPSRNLNLTHSNLKTPSIKTALNSSAKQPLILFWGIPFNNPQYLPKENSTYGQCIRTRDYKRLKEADLVVFHFTTINESLLPWKHYRGPKQIFVWWSGESPQIIDPKHYRPFGGFFNWTWTYRHDADVFRGYGFRSKALRMPRGQKVVDEIVAGKKTLAVWFVSNCGPTRGARERLEYANDLVKAGLRVEMFGKCFGNEQLFPMCKEEEIKRKVRGAKFYLAFENALHCKDYITEKFWNTALGNGAVPVVWGPTKDDVIRVAPSNSFIHTEDFASPEMLVRHLNLLDQNPKAYREYFRWREQEGVSDDVMMTQVEGENPGLKVYPRPKTLCEVFLEKGKDRKTIESLEKEFVLNNPKECYEENKTLLW